MVFFPSAINQYFSEAEGTIVLENLRQIVQIVDDNVTEFLRGKEMNEIKIIGSESKDLAIVIVDGIIKDIGRLTDLESKHDLSTSPRFDCEGGCLLPGLVDGHSHPVFAGDRVHEFAMKLAGATYMEVQAAGGGIHFTTTKTREAPKAALVSDFKKIADQMLKFGTTTLEAKSGYGLNWESELKMLEAIEEVALNHPLEISGTFCGAHAVPKGKTETEQTREIVDKMIPKLRQIKREGQLKTLENIDVFCEKGVFELETSKEILTAGKNAGFHINFHADELHPLKGAEMGASIGARAMSHLEEISSDGIEAMASAGTVATLLPSTAYMLRLNPPPAREMIEKGVIVALGSDFNPNAYCLSMSMIMHLACVTFKMSMPEALVAATLNSAHSIGRGKSHGAIAINRIADFILIDAPKWEHFIYQFGGHSTIISAVFKRGKVVYQKSA